MSLPFLSLLILIPLMGVIFLLLVKGTADRNAKAVAFWIACLNLILALVMLGHFDPTNPEFQFVEKYAWIESLKCSYHLGIDGLSVYFVVLAALLTPICVLSSFSVVQKRVREYMMAFLLLEALMIGVFCALDIVLFYLFFESVLIPMFLIIGLWGGSNRIYACFKFFLYTLFASLFMLIAFVKLYSDAGTTNLIEVADVIIPLATQKWLFIGFVLAFAVKIPMWPVHTWLPDAHTEAPTAGSVLLAGVLLKLGGYGLLRIVMPILPEACREFSFYINVLSVSAIVYASLVALAQKDMKRLIAYSSIAHMGFVTLGIFSFSARGYNGAVIQMISHGLISSALFLGVGVLYDRYHTRNIGFFSGMAAVMPKFAVLFFLTVLGSIGLPGTSGFIGEFFVLMASFSVNKFFTVIASMGMILGAVYMLWLYRRVFMGKPSHQTAIDVTKNEMGILCILVILILGLGFYPQILIDSINETYPKIYGKYK